MRKCWNCGQPTNNENSRVCSDEICQRAEKKSINGEFKHRVAVGYYERIVERQREYRQRPENKAKAREYRQRPENKAKARERAQRPEVKAKEYERRQRPENKAKAREYRQRPEVRAKMREHNRKYYLRKKKLREEE